MTIDESSGATVVSYDSTGLTKAMLAAPAVLLAIAAYDLPDLRIVTWRRR